MALKTSLLITGDASVARKAVDDLAAGVRALDAAGKEAATGGLAAQERAEIEGAAAAKAMAAAQAAVADQLHQVQAAAAGYQAALRQQASTIAALQGANAGLTSELRQSQAAAAGLDAQLAATRASAAGASGSLDALTADLAGMRGELATLQAANGQLVGDLQRAQAGGAALAGELADVRQAAAGTSVELARLRTDATTTAAEVARLGTVNAALEGQLGEAKVAAGALAGELNETQQALAAMAGRVDVLETRLQSTNVAHVAAASGANAHKAAMQNLGYQVQDVAAQLSIVSGPQGILLIAAQQGGQIFSALAQISQASQAASSGVATVADSGGEAGDELENLGGKVIDVAGKVENTGTKFGKFAAFMAGPWGAGILVAGVVLAPLVESLLDADDALEKVELGSNGVVAAQSALGQIFDLTTGKLKSQNAEMAASNELLRLNIRLTAINMRAEAASEKQSSDKAFDAVGSISVRGRVAGFGEGYSRGGLVGGVAGAIAGGEGARFNSGNLAGVVDGVRNGRIKSEDALRASERLDFSGTGATRQDFQAALRDAVSSRAKVDAAERIDRSLDTGRLDTGLRQEATTRKPRDRSAAANALAGFGRDAGDKIAGIVGEFDRVPGVIDKAGAKVRELDDLIDDLNRRKPEGFAELAAAAEAAKVTVQSGLIRSLAEAFEKPKTIADKAAVAFGDLDAVIADLQQRKPPGFEQLIVEAKEARGAIEAGLNHPLDDFIQQQRESHAVNELLIRGRLVEADALRTILSIEKQRGPLSEAQRAEIVASTAALRDQERQLERVHERQRINLDALADMRDIVRTTIFEGPQSIAKIPERLFASFKAYNAERIAEEMFGDLFRDLRDRVTGASKVDAATQTLVGAFSQAAASASALSGSLSSAAGVPAGGSGAIAGTMTPGFGLTRDAAGGMTSSLLTAGFAGVAVGRTKTPADSEGEIQVIARKRSEIYGDTIAGVLKKVGIGKDTAADIGKGAGRALAGAMEGQAAAGIAGMVGIRTNKTGASLGGAIGGLTGLPGAGIIGGLAGGILGGLFGGKPKEYGSSTISIGGGEASAGTAIGKGAAERETAGALGGSVADGLNRIAQALGGDLSGTASVSIGYRPGHKAPAYRVDTTGAGRVTGVEAFKTEAEAVAFAIRDAIADGAIAGLSSAVQRALSSSTDVDKGVREALKVQEVESLIGGSLAEYQKAFRAFEAQAKDRVRIATQYGFDVVAIEKRNAEDRANLAAQLARAQTGSLQSLIDEMTTGALFEGSALDRITVLNEAIAKAKADLDNNVEGAGDRLASLYEQRLGASKDAYGATAAYAADRSATIGEAQAAIARVNAQITQANEAKSDPALTTTNATLDEIADQNARLIAQQQQTNGYLAQIAAGGGSVGSFDLRSLAAL